MKALSNKTVVAVLMLIILFPLGYSVVSSALPLGSASPEPFLELPNAKDGEKCVIEADYGRNPRFAHMDVLKQVRDEAVREGKRGGTGLEDCWRCHANKDLGTSRERFCDRCHAAVNLHLSCFECHRDPESAAETGH